MRNYIEVFVKSYYELTDKGWQVVALYKRIYIQNRIVQNLQLFLNLYNWKQLTMKRQSKHYGRKYQTAIKSQENTS